MVQVRLTARLTSRAGTKVGHSELGLERRETVRSLSAVGVRKLRKAAPSTRGPEWTNPWCSGCIARCIAG